MNFDDYRRCDATELARRVASGDVQPAELLQLALARHQATHTQINAIARLMEPQARERLQQWQREPARRQGPFAGVPFLLKDSSLDYAGLPTGYGSRALQRLTPTRHAHAVRRYLDAGLLIFGKTNLPELALKGQTDPLVNGRSRNPWHLDHTPGGSSGGAAAAVAAGVVPMAAGSDGGGSIRIPAACSGLFGLTASRGRISAGPQRAEVWFGASSEGVLSRSVRDTARALDVLQGEEPGDPFVIAPPAAPYAELMQRDPGRLRIGFSTASPIGTPVHPEAVAAVQDAVALLQRLGHEVEEAAPEIDGAALATSYLHLYFGQVPAMMALAREAGASEAEFELLTRVIGTLGRAVNAGVLTRQLATWGDFTQSLGRFHQTYDLLLTPTLAHPPVRHGQGDPPAALQAVLGVLQRTGLLAALARLGLLDSTVQQIARDNLQYVPFTQLANLTGRPAMSVPLHWTADGLPLGVQFVARFGREDTLLQLAAQLEATQPWFHRLPTAV